MALAAAALVAATVIAATVQYGLLARRLGGQIEPGPRRRETRRWIRLSAPLFMAEGFALIILNLDILLLNWLGTPPDQIGIYFAALRTISLVAFVHFLRRPLNEIRRHFDPQLDVRHHLGDGFA